MYLGGLSKNHDTNSRKDTGFHDFSVDYSSIINDKIVDIHNCLMKKNNII